MSLRHWLFRISTPSCTTLPRHSMHADSLASRYLFVACFFSTSVKRDPIRVKRDFMSAKRDLIMSVKRALALV